MGTSHDTTTEQTSTAAAREHSAVSFRALAWVAQLRGVTWSERGVLIKLADHAREETELAWPSVDLIAKWAGVDERTVRRILGRLLARGLIEVSGANNRGGGRCSTTYRLRIPDGFKAGDREDSSATPDDPRRGDIPVRPARNGHGRGDIPVHAGGTPESPEAIKKKLPSSSVLTDGALRRARRGQSASRSKAKPASDEAIRRQENEAIRRQWQLTGKAEHEAEVAEAARLLLALRPKLNREMAVSDLYGLKGRYDHTWPPVINALVECSQVKPPPANPMRWLLRHAERHGNRLAPEF